MKILYKNAFTLIELLAVIVILAIIALIAVPTIISIITRVRITSSQASMNGYIKAINNASALFNLENDEIPKTVEDLQIEAKNIENIELINLTFNENGNVKKAKAMINGFYCIYKENEASKCSEEQYAYIKSIYNLAEIDKETIQNIYFVDEPRTGTPIDISVDGNETVLLYLEENGNIINEKNMYNAYIYSELMISAPQNSGSFFRDLTNVITIDFNDMFDTSNVTSMTNMFLNCNSLKTLDLSGFDTSNVINMTSMFRNMNSVEEIDLSSFNTSNVTSMDNMFFHCSSLTEIDLNNFYTDSLEIMGWMFEGCTNLKSINMDNFNTSKVGSLAGLFWECKNLESINLSSFDTSNVTNMRGMFRDCNSLTELNLSNFDTSKVTNMHQMFSRTHTLAELDLSSFNTSNVTNMSEMFQSMGSDATNVSLNLGGGILIHLMLKICHICLHKSVIIVIRYQ